MSVPLSHFEIGLDLGRLGEWEVSPLPPSNYYHIGLCYDRMGRREKAKAAYAQSLEFSNTDHIKAGAQECLGSPCTK